MNTVKGSLVIRDGGRWRMKTDNFRIMQLLCMTSQWSMYVIAPMSKPIDGIIPEENLNIKLGLWLLMKPMYHYQS